MSMLLTNFYFKEETQMTIKEGIAAAFGGIAAAWAAGKIFLGKKEDTTPKAGESEATTATATTPAPVETTGETKEEKENA